METTAQNTRIADKLLGILSNEHCSVQQAQDILSFVSSRVKIYGEVKYSAGSELLANGFDR